MLRYYKLFDLLMRKGMKKTELLKVISSGSLAKLGKGENIQTEIIEKICDFLECQPGDIMETVSYTHLRQNRQRHTEKAGRQKKREDPDDRLLFHELSPY